MLIDLSFNGINYTDHPNTISEHFRSQLGNLNNKVVVVGGGYASTVNKQTEAGCFFIFIFLRDLNSYASSNDHRKDAPHFRIEKKPDSYSILEKISGKSNRPFPTALPSKSHQNCSKILTHGFSIYFYGIVSRQDSVLVMGGLCDGVEVSRVAKFSSTGNWSRKGNLQEVRSAHRAISNGDRVYVVGGSETL